MRRHAPPAERLRYLPLFAGCTADELSLVARNVTEHRARAGDVLVREGAIGREFFVIVEGNVTVLVSDRPVARLGRGDFFGEIALLDQYRRTATVVAETDVILQIASTSEFNALLAGAPGLTQKLLAGLARRLRFADARTIAGVPT